MTTSTPAPAFSMDDLTMGEIAQIEELSGQSISVMGDDAAPKAKLMASIYFIAKRRENPEFTFSEAEAGTMGDFNALLNSPDPKE